MLFLSLRFYYCIEEAEGASSEIGDPSSTEGCVLSFNASIASSVFLLDLAGRGTGSHGE